MKPPPVLVRTGTVGWHKRPIAGVSNPTIAPLVRAHCERAVGVDCKGIVAQVLPGGLVIKVEFVVLIMGGVNGVVTGHRKGVAVDQGVAGGDARGVRLHGIRGQHGGGLVHQRNQVQTLVLGFEVRCGDVRIDVKDLLDRIDTLVQVLAVISRGNRRTGIEQVDECR